MAIKYTQVLNSFVSTEGSAGIMTNYIYYSLLVVNTDGSKQIVEGKSHEISWLLSYVRTPIDEIEDLKETVRNLRRDINEIADQKAKYLVDSLFPLPDILNKNEVEAIDLLEKAGLEPVFLNRYPETTPKNGIVRAYARNAENFKKVDVRIIHDLPAVTGLKMEDALEQLTAAGFQTEIAYKTAFEEVAGTVMQCTRGDENTLNVALLVSNAAPETKGLPMDEARRLLHAAGCRVVIDKSEQPGEPGQVVAWENISEHTVKLYVNLPEQVEEAKKLLQATGCTVVVEKSTQPGEPGQVITWECIGDRTVKLYVSVPDKYKTKHVAVQWSDLQDSTGDTYSATAEFCNNTQVLRLRLTYKIGAKTKHQLLAVHMKTASRFFLIRGEIQSDVYMEPGAQNTVAIDFPVQVPFEELSKEATVFMQTQYGIMKKRDSAELQLAFEW